MTATRMRLSPPETKPKAVPLAERGRMLYVNDVLDLLPKKNGKPSKSSWWVRNKFAPEHKHYLGRDPYWWEIDVQRWLDSQTGEEVA